MMQGNRTTLIPQVSAMHGGQTTWISQVSYHVQNEWRRWIKPHLTSQVSYSTVNTCAEDTKKQEDLYSLQVVYF
jgi:hypothetical protein